MRAMERSRVRSSCAHSGITAANLGRKSSLPILKRPLVTATRCRLYQYLPLPVSEGSSSEIWEIPG